MLYKRALKYFIPCFLLMQFTYSMEKSSADKEAYENRKKALLRQADLLVPYTEQFFECFSCSFPVNKSETEMQKKIIERFMKNVKKVMNGILSVRLNFELDLMENQKVICRGGEFTYSLPLIRGAWEKSLSEIRYKREETLRQWPDEQRKKFPHLAIAAFLNEIQVPKELGDTFRPYINPQDFIELKNLVD